MSVAAKTYARLALTALALVALPSIAHAAETYRLIHAVGNDEREVARGLSKSECEARKEEYKAVAGQLGTYNEATGNGSITCLPESFF